MTAEACAAGRRVTHQERRERRAAVDDPAVVLEAAARFLEVRSRSVAEVRRRLTGAGYKPDLVEGAVDAAARARPPRRRGVRASVDRVARPGAAARRTRDPPGARAEGRRPDQRGPRPRRTARSRGRVRGDGRRWRRRSRPIRRRRNGCWHATDGSLVARRRSPPATAARLRVARPQRLRSGGLPHRRRDGR